MQTTMRMLIPTALLLLSVNAATAQDCVGDCDGDGEVEINELILGVNISLGSQPLDACPAFDCEDTGTVPISCLIQAVNNSLEGCTPPGNCPLEQGLYTMTQVEGGVLRVGNLSPIPFPSGGALVADVAGATEPECVHNAVVPFPNGLTSPAFCIPAFGFTARITQTGCGIGRVDSNGGSDFDIVEVGDTSSQPECNNQQECLTGIDDKVRVDVSVGDGTADECPVNTAQAIFSVPVMTVSWLDRTMPFQCPSADGEYNPETDTLILEVQQILDFTTSTNFASWSDLSGDGCPIAGVGPPQGFEAMGACWDIGAQTITIGAAGTVGSPSPTLYDFTFSSELPSAVSRSAFTNATCESPPAIDFDGSVVRCLE